MLHVIIVFYYCNELTMLTMHSNNDIEETKAVYCRHHQNLLFDDVSLRYRMITFLFKIATEILDSNPSMGD